MTRSIRSGKTPQITIPNVAGDLSVVGWETGEVLIKADEDELHLEQEEERWVVACEGDMVLRVPEGSTIQIGLVSGEASLRNLSGPVIFDEIRGDLSLRQVKAISGEKVMGDLTVRDAQGDLSVKNVEGDTSIRDHQGDVQLGSVSDDIAVREVKGNIEAMASEDAVLYLSPEPGTSIDVTAGENILLVLPVDADASLTLQGTQISMDWPGLENNQDETVREVRLGAGSARINLKAGGQVRMSSNPAAGESADEFGNFAGLNFDWSGFNTNVTRQVNRTVRKSAKTLKSALKQVEKAHASHTGRWSLKIKPEVQTDAAPPGPAPVSNEERMVILKMLQEKKINAEQADQLLKAMEGGGNVHK
jgi:hypothetical protein